MLTAGVELGKLRLALEYNLVPATDVQVSTGTVNDKIPNSYLAITAGFFIGGGKWGK